MVAYGFLEFSENIKYYAYQRKKIMVNGFCLQMYVSTHKTHINLNTHEEKYYVVALLESIIQSKTFRSPNI